MKELPAATRDGFGDAMLALGKAREDIVVLCADVTESVRVKAFEKAYPKQFVATGIAEQNMIATSVGLALSGKTPFAVSYAAFNPGRNFDHIRVGVCYNQANVKIVGGHAGLMTGPDGATHQMLEDIALMRVLPHMTVLAPADYWDAYQLTEYAAHIKGPVYLRLGRAKVPRVHTKAYRFFPHQLDVLKPGKGAVILTTGSTAYRALEVARHSKLKQHNISVVHCPVIKPLPEIQIVRLAKKHSHIFTLEEHQMAGGFGSAVIESLVRHRVTTPITQFGIQDTFGESGEHEDLWGKYGFGQLHLVQQIKTLFR